MAIDSKTKEINGRLYTVTMQPSLEALDTLELLSKLLGPAIAALGSGGLNGELAPAAEALFGKLGGGQLKHLARELLKGVTVQLPGRNGEVVEARVLEIVATHFAGRLFEMFQVMAFAAETNFRDFFDGMGNLLASRAPAAPASPSTSQTA